MPASSFTLAQFPLPMVELACDKCGRRGRLRKARLIEAYGPDVALPDLRTLVAKCERAGSMSDGCGARLMLPRPLPRAFPWLSKSRLSAGRGGGI